jgi:hypothetical protein
VVQLSRTCLADALNSSITVPHSRCCCIACLLELQRALSSFTAASRYVFCCCRLTLRRGPRWLPSLPPSCCCRWRPRQPCPTRHHHKAAADHQQGQRCTQQQQQRGCRRHCCCCLCAAYGGWECLQDMQRLADLVSRENQQQSKP